MTIMNAICTGVYRVLNVAAFIDGLHRTFTRLTRTRFFAMTVDSKNHTSRWRWKDETRPSTAFAQERFAAHVTQWLAGVIPATGLDDMDTKHRLHEFAEFLLSPGAKVKAVKRVVNEVK